MTCHEFDETLDAMIAGDAGPAARARIERHASACARCRRRLRASEALRGSLEEGARVMETPMTPDVDRARARLRDAFARAGLPPIRFAPVPTPIGRLFVAVSDRGVCDLALAARDEAQYRGRLRTRAPEIARDDRALRPVVSELEAYFAGELRAFSVPVDLRGTTAFTRQVLEAAQRIPFGTVLSYGELAARLGARDASRAVGGALGRNPVPIIVPCHRVVQRDGSLGGYTGGLSIKQSLLRIEGYLLV